jgi:polysaccharide chain length determinant protein (PEP-CTERM system associated)
MDDLIKQFLVFLRGMWKFRWPGVVTAWVVAAVGVVLVYRVPDQYEASARIFVDTQSILKPLLSGLTVQPNVDQQISMLSRTLLSRPNLEKLVRMADLDLKVKKEIERDELITELGQRVEIRNTGRDNLYTLAIRDKDQDRAKRIIQSLTSIFVESSLGATRKDSDSAKSFLNEQIRRYEQKLEEAEMRLKDFRIRNLQMQSNDGKDATSRMAEASAQLESARLQLKEAENARDAIKQQLTLEKSQGGGSTLPNLLPPPPTGYPTPEIDSRIDGINRNLDSLLQRFTDQHPDVVSGRRQLKELEAQKAREVESLRKAAAEAAAQRPPETNTSASLATQELSRMLASSEVQVATLRARVVEFSSRLAQARESMKTAPQLEAEASQLNRDYNMNRKNYEDLIGRRQSAIMSGDLEVASGVADFRLIDPPRVTPKPVSPNRLVMLPMALAAGLGAGLALAFLLSQLRPAYYDPSALREKTGLPLLGVVSLRIDDQLRRKERGSLIRFVSATASLVALFAVGLVVTAVMA